MILPKTTFPEQLFYFQLQKILKNRQELQGATSIRRIYSIPEKETVSCIGMILDISKTKNENYLINLEDKTGSHKVIITKNSQAYDLAKDLTADEVIGMESFGASAPAGKLFEKFGFSVDSILEKI